MAELSDSSQQEIEERVSALRTLLEGYYATRFNDQHAGKPFPPIGKTYCALDDTDCSGPAYADDIADDGRLLGLAADVARAVQHALDYVVYSVSYGESAAPCQELGIPLDDFLFGIKETFDDMDNALKEPEDDFKEHATVW